MSRTYYDKRRAGHKKHNLTLIAFACRCCSALFVMLREAIYIRATEAVTAASADRCLISLGKGPRPITHAHRARLYVLVETRRCLLDSKHRAPSIHDEWGSNHAGTLRSAAPSILTYGGFAQW